MQEQGLRYLVARELHARNVIALYEDLHTVRETGQLPAVNRCGSAVVQPEVAK